MKRIYASAEVLIEDPDGQLVTCTACSEAGPLALAQTTGDVVVVAPNEPIPATADAIGRLLRDVQRGQGLAGSDDDAALMIQRDIALARAQLRERSGRYLLAGRANRVGPLGEEDIALLAVVAAPLREVGIRIALRADDMADAA